MARFIDERQETEDDNEVTDINELVEQEAPQEPTPEPTEPEDDLPEKYKGKSTAEIVRMHQEAEKLLGRQSSEVGELRKVVDDYIQTQLDTQAPKQTAEQDEEIDWYSDPDKAMERAIANHPSVKKAEEAAAANARSSAMSQLQARHPDMESIVKDAKFVEWIKASKIRTQLFAQADRNYDYEAADELFTTWKERQGAVAQTVADEKGSRKQAINKASTGSVKGNGEQRSKKVYRRSDIIKLMKEDPKRYLDLSDEIHRAYAENRVR
jgi:hypothetical protein